jgi:voltage-gated potassium channel Kch
MRKASVGDRLRYAFDNMMARGPIALIGWLAVVAIALIVPVTVLVWVSGGAEEGTFTDQLWNYALLALDVDIGSATWALRLVALIVVFIGIFVLSTLIGVLTAGVEGRIEDLRKGRSRVIESNHTIVLGWSEQIFTVVSELVVANANQRRSCIVILGEKDKVEMEDELRERLGKTGRTHLVCRTGSPIEMADLEIVSLQSSRAIIILSPEEGDPDSQVIKTILAITNAPTRRPAPYHIVAEIRDPKNMEAARLVGRGEVELVLTGHLVSRVIAQTCRQSGLSVVYTELLDFGGDEIYFKEEPALVGKTLGEALLAYEDSAVIGLCSGDGCTRLNPSLDTRVGTGDRIIAISADDDTVVLSGKTDLGIVPEAIHSASPTEPAPERTLILGWNWRACTVINELDNYVVPGSQLTVVADGSSVEEDLARYCAGLAHQTVTFQSGDTTDRRTLDELAVHTYNHVVLLCYDNIGPQEADARTLISLLHLRDIAEQHGHAFSIVSEMLDIRNRNLAEVTRADDFIVSDKLVSLMLAQVAENKSLNAVFADIFDPEGSEIYLKPMGDYIALGRPVNFYTGAESARRRGDIAIGYRLHALASDAGRAYGVVVNPDKSAEVVFGEKDKVIVIAED